ncbi:hypothetical protein SAMN05443428_10881 [Caloramator quimbayensis]|uniref:Zinc-ribbon domain-containing protein n=1 Tax=Caloramator quimbayensis TaxID=1147123 RepID=A0A1T4XFS3_9CLOT|nr:zinc ribbon domain-containing protein [Caloramator quimbayensis]SKA87931.1 hypothetical protein SAMN05443428_10881 [Caloramator quimbayensis]
MTDKISKERKITYYIGLGFIIIGVILFMSSFFIGFEPSFSFGPPTFFKNAVIGMIFIMIGAVLTSIGARGAAGSGILLDPEKAREDLKPFNKAKGGMINDTLENIDVIKDIEKVAIKNNKEVIKIKCKYCGTLNDENAKFCKECGKSI